MRRFALIAFILMVGLGSTACFGSQSAPTTQTQATTADLTYVTAFGTVQCAENRPLELPVDVKVTGWLAEAGLNIPPQTGVFQIDMPALQAAAERLQQQLAAAQTVAEACEYQIAAATREVERLQAASTAFNAEKTLTLLDALARASSTARRNACAADLLANLETIACVAHYHTLVDLTGDQARLKSNARPILRQMQFDLQEELQTWQIQLLSLSEKRQANTADLLLLSDKTAIIKEIINGTEICGVGSFTSDGTFRTNNRTWLLDQLAADRLAIPAGSRIGLFSATDTSRLLVNIEEQLIAQVRVGAEVQISPLYDGGVVWLGTVDRIADRAESSSGETVIPVIIVTEESLPDPGYNVVVKIKSVAG